MTVCSIPVAYYTTDGSVYAVDIEYDDLKLARAIDGESVYSESYREEVRVLVSRAIYAKFGKLMKPYWSNRRFDFGDPVYPEPKTLMRRLCDHLRRTGT